jgi:TonB-linked SusC/RagA family outer membrane protein
VGEIPSKTKTKHKRSSMFKKLLTLLVFALLSGSLYAQVSISGTVTDAETGETLPGVNILITELQRGAATDVDGDYTVNNVPAGTYTVRATFVGYQTFTATLQVGNQNVDFDIALESDVFGLDDVVVTAFGIQRERRALGYGVAEVSAETIENRSDPNIARSLSGSLPGVDITSSGGLTGSGTDIVIRGLTSLTGSNQPLWIVDGVRFDGGSNATSGSFTGGGQQVTPNRFLDLDPNNIADVTVLKGLSATVLYGEQGRNGVIIVTTKSGSFSSGDAPAGFSVTVDQSIYATEISSRPDYQDTYGGGFDQNFGWFFSNWGPRFDTDNPSLFGSDYIGTDADGTILIEHPLLQNATQAEAFPELVGVGYRYEAKPDPLDAFFRTGLASNTSLNISGGTNDLRINANYSHSGEEGFTPNNDLTRDAFSIGANYKISDRLSSQTTFNFSLTDVNTPPSSAGGGSGPAAAGGTPGVFGYVMFTPRSIDLGGIPFINPVTGGSAYYRSGNDIPNPRWIAERTGYNNLTDRYYGKTEMNFKAADGVNLVYRLGYDSYNEYQEYFQDAGGVEPADFINGYYQTISQRSVSWDHNVNALLSFQVTEDVSLDATLGAQYVSDRFERQGLESVEMIVTGFFNHNNFLNTSAGNSLGGGGYQRLVETENAGVFAEATIGFQDFIYLNVAGRNDWFSTLEADNRSIFYPSASVSYVLSDHLDITSDALTYLKIFAGVGSSAGQPGAYSTRSTLGTNARAFAFNDGSVVTTNFTSNFLGNPDLKPELHTEYEGGVDIRFFNDRVGLSASAYARTTSDLITSADLDPATGFTSTLTNIGEVQNQGLELTLNATPIQSDLRWDIQANFFTNRSEVTELGAGLNRIQIGGGFTTRGNFAIKGEPYGVMLGSRIERVTQELKDSDPNFADVAIGTPIVGSTGNYIEQNDIGIIGDPNPDWDLTLNNTFRYKGASLSFQVDYQQGGDMFSVWISTLMARGLTTDTDRVDRNNTFILPGVNESGDPNTVQISPSGVFFSNFGFGADELRVYDMTHIRLANVALSYDLPTSLLGNTPFKQITLSVTGDNLWMYAFNVPEGSGFDPNVNSIGGNSRGFDYLTGPAARRFGGSVRFRF